MSPLWHLMFFVMLPLSLYAVGMAWNDYRYGRETDEV